MWLISNDGFADLSWKLGSKVVNPTVPLPYRVCFLVYCDIICKSAMVIATPDFDQLVRDVNFELSS
jgi:hypothetical protein